MQIDSLSSALAPHHLTTSSPDEILPHLIPSIVNIPRHHLLQQNLNNRILINPYSHTWNTVVIQHQPEEAQIPELWKENMQMTQNGPQ